MGTLQSWLLKGFVFPWEGPSFARSGLILLCFTKNWHAENLVHPEEKVAGFGSYFVFQHQLWNPHDVLVEQKFLSNLMFASQDFSVWSFPNTRWTLVNPLKGNQPASLALIAPLLLKPADTPPQKPEPHKAARSERKQSLSDNLCYITRPNSPFHLFTSPRLSSI